jgi:hypothetical protein
MATEASKNITTVVVVVVQVVQVVIADHVVVIADVRVKEIQHRSLRKHNAGV